MNGPSWMPYVTLLSPIVVAVVLGILNMWQNSAVAAERDKNHNEALTNLAKRVDEGQTSTTQSLAKFGERLGGMQDEVIRLQTGIGMGGDHGLFAEMRKLQGVVESVRSIQETTAAAIAARVGIIESQVHSLQRDTHA